jgi:uncharacterized protein
MIRFDFERRAGGGRVLEGRVRMPDAPPPRSAVVLVHGFKGFGEWCFFPHLAESLAAAGHAVVSFTHSGSRVSGPRDEVADLDAFAAATLSGELSDLAELFEAVRSGDLLPFRPHAVGLLGHSRGGGEAVLHAAHSGGVDALVTWAAVSTFDRWSEETRQEWREAGQVLVLNTRTGQQLPLNVGLLEDFERNEEQLDVLGAARRLQAPWLVVHGTDDLTVRVEEGAALARAASVARLHLVEGTGHTFGASHPMEGRAPEALEEAVRVSVAHFASHLAPSGA